MSKVEKVGGMVTVHSVGKLYRARGSMMLIIPREVVLRAGLNSGDFVRVSCEQPGRVVVEALEPQGEARRNPLEAYRG